MTTNFVIETGAGAPQERAPRLQDKSDAELQALVSEVTALLEERAVRRKRDAIEQIQRLAKEQGLNVKIDKPKRRRGRPPKAKPVNG
ncbi:hypothetical protein U879_05980 [Defluviimonas sp. 20V17]|uniref:H-NS histone family protein n=1 Tax=Allgaiera indica TaxID=765699 RepID=A0AAN4UP58_9RHOB|nr:hypothetical protein [Allgaiera indica]KDB04582.1 hypothetical protein U879_05980 [Defluviimonas sp. 20V17]GHD99792.1 hypothetical protein GCM10008024_08720 [Allgaiera indica]SDW18104.1 H-NS histone family protein [Allgaiera indica]